MRIPVNPHLRTLIEGIPPSKPGRKRIHPDSLGTRPTGIPKVPDHLPPQQDVEMLREDARYLEEVVANAVYGGLAMRTAIRLIQQEHVLPHSKQPRWDRYTIRETIKRMHEEIEQSYTEVAPKAREHQVERLQQDLARMRGAVRPPWTAINQHEMVLARLLGTLQPVRVQVDVMQAVKVSIAGYIAEMTEVERDALVAEQLQLEARARVLDVPVAAE